ncbi:MAG: hypothetical protein IPI67_26855 [Myxococcales bacterium]|nr:hypothetical protein [Myxococcales bacterium]
MSSALKADDDNGITLTREDLFDLVWSKPMSKLAPEFGMSDVALAKRCKRLGIPYPGVGYWARLAAGQKLKRPKLPPPPKSLKPWELEITFRKPPVQRHEEPEPPAPEVVVRDALRSPHAVVDRLRAELREAGPDHNGLLRVSQTRVTDTALKIGPDSISRTLRALDALFKVLAEREHEVLLVETGYEKNLAIKVTVEGENVELTLEEVVGWRPHFATEDEKRDHKSLGTQVPKHDRYPSGQLKLRVQGGSIWSDSKAVRLEELLGRVVVDVERAAKKLRQGRIDMERQHAEREAEQRRRLRTERLGWYKRELAKAFERMAADWRKSQDLQAFVTAYEQALGTKQLDSVTERWLAAVKRYAKAVDPLNEVEQLATELNDRSRLSIADGC